MQSPLTHLSLISQLQGTRNERAWEEFVQAYEPFLKSLVVRQGVPSRHVPDVTQQVLFSIARSVEGWQDDGNPASFRRWVTRVARNVVIKFMTRERRQPGKPQGGSDLLDLLQNVPDVTDPVQTQQYEHELICWAAVQVRKDFRESSWAAFRETVIEGRPVPEVAEELGVSTGSIYMSRSRIMARIRSRVSKMVDDLEAQQ